MRSSRLAAIAASLGLGFALCGAPRAGAQTVEVIHSFVEGDLAQGWAPIELIAGDAGTLYGATRFGGVDCRPYIYLSGCGVVFELASSASPRAIHDLGYAPWYHVVRLTWLEGVLYGTHSGAISAGHLFQLSPTVAGPWDAQLLHPFFGAWQDPATGQWEADGKSPRGPVFLANDGQLYGSTHDGGEPGEYGTLYRLWPDGSGYDVVHSFIPYDNSYYQIDGTGDSPVGTLVQRPDGHIYGATWRGGPSYYSSYGTLFRLRSDTDEVERVHFFGTAAGGYAPEDGLTLGPDGRLFGTTPRGRGGWGTVFEVTVGPEAGAAATLTYLHYFTEPLDGAWPEGELTWAPDRFLYGATEFGGLHGKGTVFRIRPDGSGYEIIHSFTGGSDGARPSSPRAVSHDGALYGTAREGGSGNGGVIYGIQLPTDSLLEGLISWIEGLVDDGTLKNGQGGSLLQKLQQALDAGDTQKATTMLTAFVHQVSAFKNAGILSPEQADEMIGIAEAAIASISS